MVFYKIYGISGLFMFGIIFGEIVFNICLIYYIFDYVNFLEMKCFRDFYRL